MSGHRKDWISSFVQGRGTPFQSHKLVKNVRLVIAQITVPLWLVGLVHAIFCMVSLKKHWSWCAWLAEFWPTIKWKWWQKLKTFLLKVSCDFGKVWMILPVMCWDICWWNTCIQRALTLLSLSNGIPCIQGFISFDKLLKKNVTKACRFTCIQYIPTPHLFIRIPSFGNWNRTWFQKTRIYVSTRKIVRVPPW